MTVAYTSDNYHDYDANEKLDDAVDHNE